MKRRKIGKVISLCLAAVILATSQGSWSISQGAVLGKEMEIKDKPWINRLPVKALLRAAKDTAASPVDKIPEENQESLTPLPSTPTTATSSTAAAAPSESDSVFKRVKPEYIPDYYQAANHKGKKFWKFTDRYGEVQYRDYGFKKGEAEFPLWYQLNEKGMIGEAVNLDKEYYDSAPYLYESSEPSEDCWQRLFFHLGYEEEPIAPCKKEAGQFNNWGEASAYEVWHVEVPKEEESQKDSIKERKDGFCFHGTIQNQKDREEAWYRADNKGNVLELLVLENSKLLAAKTCKIDTYADIPGQYRHSRAVTKNVSGDTYKLDILGDSASSHFDDEIVKEKINFISNFIGWSNYRSTDNHISVSAVTGIEHIQGDPAKTSRYFSGGYFYPPGYRMDISRESLITLYGIWCPKNADMYVFAGEPYKGEMSSSSYKYRLHRIVVKRDEAFQMAAVGEPLKNGFTFTGWYYSNGNKVELPSDGSVYCGHSGRVTYVYPGFESNVNTVTFKDRDGTVLKTEQVTRGDDATPPDAPTHPGYTFTGWDNAFTNVTSELTVTAQYKANQHRLIFYGNGGTIDGVSSKELAFDYDASIDKALTDMAGSGVLKYHRFEGWYTLPAGGVKYSLSGNKMPDSDVTLYAHWTRTSSLVIFEDWNGNVLKTEEVAMGGNAAPPENPSRPGYDFTGWDKEPANIQEHTTVIALYRAREYKLILQGNGGTINGNPNRELSVKCDDSMDLALSEAGNKAALRYHTFAGWYPLPEGGDQYPQTGNKMPASDVTLYAHWTRTSSLVTYEDWNGNILKTEEVAMGGNAAPPENPSRPGYDFTGWDKEAVNIQDHTTITAQYKEASGDQDSEDDNNNQQKPDPPKEEAPKTNSGDDDFNIVFIPDNDSRRKPTVPDHGGEFIVNQDNPYDITYVKPDGSKGNDEWLGDGENWYHINSQGKVDYDWYLEDGSNSWYMLNKDLKGKIGAARYGWYQEPMDGKWYYFDTETTAMKTGWQNIDYKWYYFTEVNKGQTYFGSNETGWVYDENRPGRPFGSMFKEERTPDGYWVDGAGARKE